VSVFSIPPNLLGIKIQKYKLTHNIDSFDALKSLFCSKTGVHVFSSPPPHLLEIRFQKIIFSLLRKIFGGHFLLSHPPTYLGLKFRKKKQSPHNFDSFETLKSLCCSKTWCPFFSPLTYFRFDSKILFFSLLRKISGVHFFSPPLNYLGLKFKNRNHLTALTGKKNGH